MATALDRLARELQELLEAVDVDTTRSYDAAAAGGLPLRAALVTSAGKLGHEASRFTLVLRTTRDEAAVPGLAAELAAAAAALVSATQLYTKPGACGATLRHDVRSLTKAALRSTAAVLKLLSGSAAAGAGGLGAALRRHADEMLYHTGLVIKHADAAGKLPVSDVAAVKRRLLTTAKLVKASAVEVAEEHGLELEHLTLSDPTPPTAAAPAPAPAAATTDGNAAAPAAQQSPTAAAAAAADAEKGAAAAAVDAQAARRDAADGDDDENDDGEEDGEEDDEFDDDEGDSALTPAQRRAFLTGGLLCFKALMRLLKHALAAADVLAGLLPPPPPSADAAAADALAALSLSAPAPPAPTLPPAIGALDGVADAVGALHDAVIDVAAALNDLDAPALAEAAGALNAAADGVMAAAQAGRPLAAAPSAPPAAADALETALGEVQSAKNAAARQLASALRVVDAAAAAAGDGGQQ